MGDRDVERESNIDLRDLDVRRFEADLEIRRAELAEKRAQRKSEERRLAVDAELKRQEISASTGRAFRFTTAQATVAAAVLALVSGAVGGLVQAWTTRDVEKSKSTALIKIEEVKAKANIELERQRFETGLITKATESPKREEQIRNLKFYLAAGFLSDPEHKIAAMNEDQYPSSPPPPGAPSLLVPVASVNTGSPVRALARSIGLLQTGIGTCTGWLVDQSHVVTVSFCLSDSRDVSSATFRLGYISKDDQGDEYKILELAELERLGDDARSIGGYAILTVEPNAGKKYGALKVSSRVPKVGEKLLIVQHATGAEQKITTGECVVVETTPEAQSIVGLDLAFEYHCEVQLGAAGAPVIAISDNAVLGIVVAHKGSVDGYGLLMDAIIKNSPIVQNAGVQGADRKFR